jgi:hypothetical protein
MAEVGMNTASVEIVEDNILLILKLLLDNLSKSYSQTTPKITTTKTITYRYFPNILAKIKIYIMMILLASYLNQEMRVKFKIRSFAMLSVNSANWDLGAVISSIEKCNDNSAACKRFKGGFYERDKAATLGIAPIFCENGMMLMRKNIESIYVCRDERYLRILIHSLLIKDLQRRFTYKFI